MNKMRRANSKLKSKKATKEVRSFLLTAVVRRIHRGLLLFVAFPVVLVIRVVRPLVTIKLGRLDMGRIGGAYNAEWFLCERYAGSYDGRRYFDIFYFIISTGTICNHQWRKMWKRVLRVFPLGQVALIADNLNRRFPGHGRHVVPLQPESLPVNDNTVKCILARKKPFLEFTLEEENLGQKALQDLGMPKGTPFVCFSARDAAYLDAIYPERNWRYHDYRDSSIHNYIPTAEELVWRGYYAIRMGAIVKERIHTDNQAIIDYATNGKRTDFLDIYLGAKCRFFICSPSGISIIPEVFRKPVVYVNWLHLPNIFTWMRQALFIPKKLYLTNENRWLTFREMVESDIGVYDRSELYERKGIEVVENGPEEIVAVSIEMDERLKGTWKATKEDEELQQRFWAIFGANKLKSPELRIGAAYLRENQDLLR